METKQEQNNQERKSAPIVETHISKSKDGKYVIHKTVITDIKPKAYYEKIFEGSE